MGFHIQPHYISQQSAFCDVATCNINFTLKQHQDKKRKTDVKRLIHTYHAIPLPHSFTHAMPQPFHSPTVLCNFVKVRMVDGNIQTASTATTLYSNNVRGTPRRSRKKPNMGRSPTCCLWTADANSHIPCCGLEKSLS
jgi:hypothetical protein